ncbi:hypothetical protein Bhyg_02535 [Pseudolycoriella hygida]|uniref:Uncharacterized protein n=1 Tax=Pseudolycoriella hygida TaxID=35572 RepID=A0A9Q0NBL1_9DIPT|nr:hypothetical protein Bhyg_02535 [Pseudolycoriella hygida]
MEASVERTDSQKSQNNGPRVSFNRDVHVKRIEQLKIAYGHFAQNTFLFDLFLPI